jgi:hypothetical protein
MRSILVLAALTASAHAHPAPYYIAEDPPAPPIEWRSTPATFEWSTWLGLGFGAASSPPPAAAARTTQPGAPAEPHVAWIFHGGVDVTLPITHAVRVGPWLGIENTEAMTGVELSVTRAPADVDMFWYRGEGVWTLRAGGGDTHATAALGWGYRCPWKLWGPYSRTSRYEIGARIMFVVTRAYTEPRDWTGTLGLEVEPVGALRYLLGIKRWY